MASVDGLERLTHVAQGDDLIEQGVGIAANGKQKRGVRQQSRPLGEHAVEEGTAQALVRLETGCAQRAKGARVQCLMVATDTAAAGGKKHLSRFGQ